MASVGGSGRVQEATGVNGQSSSMADEATVSQINEATTSESNGAAASIPAVNGEVPPKRMTKAEKKIFYGMNSPEEVAYKTLTEEVMKSEVDWTVKSEMVQDIVYNICDETDGDETANPFSKLLKLFRCTVDCKLMKEGTNTVAGLVLQHFGEWLKKHGEKEMRKKYLSEAVKRDAIEKGLQTGGIKFVAKVFFTTLYSVWEMVEEKKKIGQYPMALKIIDAFQFDEDENYDSAVFDILLFYYYRQKLDDVLRNFIRNKPNLLRKFINYLDEFSGCATDKKRYEMLMKEMEKYGVSDTSKHTFGSSRAIETNIEKNLKELGDNFLRDEQQFMDLAPHYYRTMRGKRLRFFANSRLEQNENNTDAPSSDLTYFQNVTELLQGDLTAVARFVKDLWKENANPLYRDDAIRWCLYYDLDQQDPYCLAPTMLSYLAENPRSIQEIRLQLEKTLQQIRTQTTERIDELKEGIKIIMITNEAGFHEFLTEFETCEFAAMDSEFSQDIGFSSVCLMQFYINSKVFLLDFKSKALTNQPMKNWEKFIDIFFYGPSLVIGYDILNDINQLFRGTLSDMKADLSKSNNVVCLKRMAENIGCWGVRPLRVDQIRYAANDAYVVAELYITFMQLVNKYQYDWDGVLTHSSMNFQKEKQKNKKEKISDSVWKDLIKRLVKEIGKDTLKEFTIDPKSVKIMADVMHHGLGKYLRRFGFDVAMAKDKIWTRKYLQKNTDRVVITTGKGLEEWGRICRVIDVPNNPTITSLQQLALVFKSTKAMIRHGQPFYRCMECNSDEILRIPSPIVHALYAHDAHLTSKMWREPKPELEIYPFDPDEWFNKLINISPFDYDNVQCEVARYGGGHFQPDWIAVRVPLKEPYTGCIVNITKNVIVAESRAMPIMTGINKIPENVASRPGIFFYSCAYCGRFYYDGKILDSQSHSSKSEQNNSQVEPEHTGQAEQNEQQGKLK
ncbi:hypothetical protein WR25_08558 [Diploscapter pachys]|uniref:Mut7-C RNAse domain-containing protein n=1 Tax=Diploscapter pachys TaxID=2018661 RepID=A0A2A2JL44_9BILA|nr:hypothetical protein WR25_08558 [Diploscapter pachys]